MDDDSLQNDEQNGTDIIRLSVAAWRPEITVFPESRSLTLSFLTTADVEAGETGVDLSLPLTAANTLALVSALLDALREMEPPEPHP